MRNRLKNQGLDADYDQMNEQQIDELIICAASEFIRSDFTMDYKFTDLPKTKNYLGFESGVFCSYPNNIDTGLLSNNQTCEESGFF